ncbi:MAG: hypothetical protein WCF98_00100 [Synechococcus sp. ELA057]|jgi:hypothetical protein
MAPSSERSSSGSGVVLSSALAGAVLGAAGLTWWLLSTAERRREARRHLEQLRQAALPSLRVGQASNGNAAGEGHLHDRVQQLNAAIDDVRRQLEHLQTSS